MKDVSTPDLEKLLKSKKGDVLDLLDAAIEDISAAGLYVRTGKPLPIGAQYEIALLIDGSEEPLYCLGEVVAAFECEPDELDHPFGAGMKIISFVGDDGKRFADYIKHLNELYEFHWPSNIQEGSESQS